MGAGGESGQSKGNVTNTTALVLNGIGSVWGSLPELKGQRSKFVRLAVKLGLDAYR